mmetsp:Transcript_15438/g.60340  ORF Transcript_15438/g.60340 Transcript_15438/m.60340 type:complete len:523 (+) Transcript_15438:2133-3701(+)
MLCGELLVGGPLADDRGLEEGGEVVAVGGGVVLCDETLLLELVHERIGVRDGLAVVGRVLASDGGEECRLRLLVLDLEVAVDVEEVSGRVHDSEAEVVRGAASAHPACELECTHAQLPQTLAVLVAQQLQELLDRLWLVGDLGDDLEEDVVVLRTSETLVAHGHLEGLDGVHHDLLGLVDDVVQVDQARVEAVARTHHGTNEEPACRAVLLDGVVEVDLPVQRRDVRDPVVAQPAQLHVVGKRRLRVPGHRVLREVQPLAEGVVLREVLVLAQHKRNPAHASCLQAGEDVGLPEELRHASDHRLLANAGVGVHDAGVDDVDALALEGRALGSEAGEGGRELLVERAEVLVDHHQAGARLLLAVVVVEQLVHGLDLAHATTLLLLRLVASLPGDGGALLLDGVGHVEGPLHGVVVVVAVGDVADAVGLVAPPDVELHGELADTLVGVGKEGDEDVEEGGRLVDEGVHVLEALLLVGLSVGTAEAVFDGHLALLEGGQLVLDQQLARLNAHVCAVLVAEVCQVV